MTNVNDDTEFADALRHHGVLPPKKEAEIAEEDVINILESTVQERLKSEKQLEDLSLDELDLLEDDEDERVLQEYRKRRLAEMKAQAMKAKFGDVREISAEDYIEQVNKAGDSIWVVLHLYKPGIPLCTILNSYISQLAAKFPATKFLKSVSDTCIPNFPEKNLPTLFIYLEGNLKKQFIGADEIGGMNITIEELEWMLSKVGAVKTDLECNPKKKPKDILFSSLTESEDNDWQL